MCLFPSDDQLTIIVLENSTGNYNIVHCKGIYMHIYSLWYALCVRGRKGIFTECSRSLDQFYMTSYLKKEVKTSWTDSKGEN